MITFQGKSELIVFANGWIKSLFVEWPESISSEINRKTADKL
jgi:hypothetical protein